MAGRRAVGSSGRDAVLERQRILQAGEQPDADQDEHDDGGENQDRHEVEPPRLHGRAADLAFAGLRFAAAERWDRSVTKPAAASAMVCEGWLRQSASSHA